MFPMAAKLPVLTPADFWPKNLRHPLSVLRKTFYTSSRRDEIARGGCFARAKKISGALVDSGRNNDTITFGRSMSTVAWRFCHVFDL